MLAAPALCSWLGASQRTAAQPAMPTRTSTATISRPRFRPRWAALMISLRPGAEHRGRRIDETAAVQVPLAGAVGIIPGQRDLHAVVDIEPFRVMVELPGPPGPPA